jgi:hypothetical protein
MGCDGCDDCGGPRSNAVDQATQVSQQNKATDALSARVAAVPGRRVTDLGTLQDPNQARSLGRMHWPSKQGVLAGSIGQASKESWPEALAEQARSLGRIHRLSNEQELGLRSFLFWIFFELSSKNQAVCWYQDAAERSILVQVGDRCRAYRSAST